MNTSDNSYPVVCFGESLWIQLPEGPEAGGAPVNIARHLKMQGVNTALISRVGLDDYGKRLISFMEASSISTDFFQIDYEAPTGRQNGRRFDPQSSDAAIPQAWDRIEWEASFETLTADAEFFVHGSLSARCPVSLKTLSAFLNLPIKRVFTVQLYKPYLSKKLIEECLSKSFIIKLNVEELELITGWFTRFNQIQDRIQILQDLFHIPHIVVIDRSGKYILNANGNYFEHEGFDKTIIDEHGAEEAFLAGLLLKYVEKKEPALALEYAAALHSLVASSSGACPGYNTDHIYKIIYK